MKEPDEIIYSYTRRQALEDGQQVDVSTVAREAGIRFPVYMTRTVWAAYVEVPEGVHAQDEQGRLWDILWMLRCQIKRAEGDTVLFQLRVRNDNRFARIVTLKAVCSCKDVDDPEPAITIMLPDEN